MGQILLLLNGGTSDDNRFAFENICRTVKEKVGIALEEGETILFQGSPLQADYDFSVEIGITNEILTRRRKGLFRHLRMASSYDQVEIGDTEKYRIRIDIFYLDHFINIKIYDLIFDLIQERLPNTFELITIYCPYEKERKYLGFSPHPGDIYYLLEARSATLPDIMVRDAKNTGH